MRKNTRSNHDGGFTLIEVLVALAVLSIALGAVVVSVTQYARLTGAMDEKTLAHLVARNQLQAFQIDNPWPTVATSDGRTELSNQQWQWTQSVIETADPDLRRIDIEISTRNDPDRVLARLTAFVGKVPLKSPL